MSEKQSEEKPELDPFGQWVQFWDGWTKAWSGPMSETVASKSFAESMGQQLEGSLEATKLMRQQLGGMMQQVLQQMSLPTRQEVISLAERLTNLEMRMDDLDAKSDEILDLLKTMQESLTPNKSE
jgi:polyhydroxyalkanoate synthesis regulator phasin